MAGTPNRISGAVRSVIAKVVDKYYNSEQFLADLAELDAKDRVAAMEKLTAYTVPKLQATTLDVMSETKQTIEDKLIELSQQGDQGE